MVPKKFLVLVVAMISIPSQTLTLRVRQQARRQPAAAAAALPLAPAVARRPIGIRLVARHTPCATGTIKPNQSVL